MAGGGSRCETVHPLSRTVGKGVVKEVHGGGGEGGGLLLYVCKQLPQKDIQTLIL